MAVPSVVAEGVPRRSGATPASLVSVVVPSKDSARTIQACLRSIRSQTHTSIELIVVDNGSADGTWEVAQRMADSVLQRGPERSAQRNAGIARARGEFVLWIDADMMLPPDVVERAVGVALRERAVGVFIPEVTVGDGFWTRCRALERKCYLGELMVESPRLARREYLVATGGFVEWLAGTEDAELRMRMLRDGVVLARTDAVIVHDEGRLSLGGIARKRFYYGRGLTRYRREHPGAMAGQAGATVRAFVRNWYLLVAHPLVASGIGLMRTVETVAYLMGAMAGAVGRR